MTISFSGLASGLDTSSWIEALTSIKQLSVTSLQTKKTSISSEQAEINKIQSMFSNVQTALDRLTDSKYGNNADLFIQKSVDTHGAETYTASVTSSAALGNYDVYVQQLATATVARSTNTVSNYVSASTKLSDLGVTSGNLTVWVGSQSYDVTVSNNDTIAQFNTKLSNAGIDAQMAVNGNGTLSFVGNNNKSVALSSTTDTTNFTSKLGFVTKHNLVNDTYYYESQTSFYAMGLDTKLLEADFTGGHSLNAGTVTINRQDFTIDANTTLGGLINAINANDDAKVTAAWDTASGKLKLTSTVDGEFFISINGHNTNFTTAFAIGSPDTQEVGQNAIININGSENIYLAGTYTTAVSTEEVSAESAVSDEGTHTKAYSYDLTTLTNGFNANTTTLNNLGVSTNGQFQINGATISYNGNDTVNSFIENLNTVGASAAEGSRFSAELNSDHQIVITAQGIGDGIIDFESTIGNTTSTLAETLGFTTVTYVNSSEMLADAQTIENGVVTTLTSTDRINNNSSTYYSYAESYALDQAGNASLSTVTRTDNGAIDLSGTYTVEVNGQNVSFNSSNSIFEVVDLIDGLNGVDASYTDNKIVISSIVSGVNLTIADVTGDFAVQMGYLTGEAGNVSELTSNYNTTTHSIDSTTISNTENIVYNTLTTNDLGSLTTESTQLSALGITNSAFTINNVEISATSGMTIQQLCNAITDSDATATASYNATEHKIVLTSTISGGNAPLSVGTLSGNLTEVLGLTVVDGSQSVTNYAAQSLNGSTMQATSTNDVGFTQNNTYTTLTSQTTDYDFVDNNITPVDPDSTTSSYTFTGSVTGSNASTVYGSDYQFATLVSGSTPTTLSGGDYNFATSISGTNPSTISAGNYEFVSTISGTTPSVLAGSEYTFVSTISGTAPTTIGGTTFTTSVSVTEPYTSDYDFVSPTVTLINGNAPLSGATLNALNGTDYDFLNQIATAPETEFIDSEFTPITNSLDFIGFIDTVTPDVTISTNSASAIATAIANGATVIGLSNADAMLALADYVMGGSHSCTGITFCLTDDIDLQGINWTPIGNYYEDNFYNPPRIYGTKFEGNFNGNGHTVSNMSIYSNQYGGLFGYVSGGTISNTAVRQADIHYVDEAGGLAAIIENTAIENCYASGYIAEAIDAGGLVGYMENSAISNSSAAGEIRLASQAGGQAGGLVGMVSHSDYGDSIYDSHAYTMVYGAYNNATYCGGFVGQTYNGTNLTVDNCTYYDNRYENNNVSGAEHSFVNKNDATLIAPQVTIAGDSVNAAATAIETAVLGGATVIGISNANALQAIQQYMINNSDNCATLTFCLTDDIDLQGINWDPISGFGGTFNGNNHTISNLTSDIGGLFGDTSGADGLTKISNLSITNANIITENSSVGILAGYIMNDGFIDNVHVEGTISATSHVGGLVAVPVAGDGYVTISNCSVSASVSGTEYVGGLVYDDHNAKIYNVQVLASVSGTNYVGEIAGSHLLATYVDCNNHGTGQSFGGNESVSGVGQVNNPDAILSYTENGFKATIGGISAGDACQAIDKAISSGITTFDLADVNALLGLAEGISHWGVDTLGITFNLTNDIDLTGVTWTTIGTTDNPFQGNFDGKGHTISNLSVSGTDCVGFFGDAIGSKISNLAITNAEVTSTGNKAGIFAGTLDLCKVDNCYTTGDVVGAECVGGFVGEVDGSDLSNCYTSASVSGIDTVGGFAGYGDKLSATGIHAYNLVTSNSTNVGGLITAGTTIKISDSTCYDSTIEPIGVGAVVSGITVSDALPDYIETPTIKGLSESYALDKISYLINNYGYTTIGLGDSDALKALNAYVNGGGQTSGITFELTDDIDLSGIAWTGIGYKVDNSNYVAFNGNFNGNGHTISNLSISGTDNVGLFGYIEGDVTISNVSVIDATVSGSNCVGILVAEAYNENAFALMKIDNCYATGTVSGLSLVGGLVGHAYELEITNSYVAGSVSGVGELGGLVGALNNECTHGVIADSLFVGTVSGTESDSVGGLAGYLRYANIINSQTSAYVSGNTCVGGLVGAGHHSYITDCSVIGTVLGTEYVGGVCGDAGEITFKNTSAYNAVSGNGSEIGAFVGTTYDTASITFDNSTYYDSSNNVFGNSSSAPNGIYNEHSIEDNILMINGTIISGHSVSEAETDLLAAISNGDTTIGLSNKYALMALANVINNTTYTGSGIDFVLTSDVDLEGVEWTPIGTSTNQFEGNFLGYGHVISNLSVSGTNDVGFFGVTERGTISNLGITDATVNATGNSAGILAGSSILTTIENCYTAGTVSGTSQIGAFIGYISSAYINDSYAVGSVSGTSEVGGFIGRAYGAAHDAIITFASIGGSAAYVDVLGTSSNVGGFIGDNASNNFSYNNKYTDNSLNSAGNNSDEIAILSDVPDSYGHCATVSGTIDAENAVIAIEKLVASGVKTIGLDDANALVGLSRYVDRGGRTFGITFCLTNNIDLDGVAWNPIGDITSENDLFPDFYMNGYKSFYGNFDGNGYTISNLKVNDKCGGLFGSVIGGTITDTAIVDANISMGGILTGHATNAYIENCFTTGVVDEDCLTEANAGLISSAVDSTILNSYSSATVYSTRGGSAGLIYSLEASRLENCYATGMVSSDAESGGLINGATYNSIINNCYATGDVNGDASGGLAFCIRESTVTNSHAYNNVTGTEAAGFTFLNEYSTYTGTNTYYDSNLNGSYDGAISGVTQSSTIPPEVASSGGGGSQIIATVTGTASVAAAVTEIETLVAAGATTIGLGDANALKALANYVNVGHHNCSGLTFCLTGNIDLDGAEWSSIGTDYYTFRGNFDGNGNTISNFSVNGTNYVGLFGYVSGGTISNTAVTNATINASSYSSGALVGYLAYGSVDNCYSNCTVSGQSNTGGLVGQAFMSEIADSFTAGYVNGLLAGGLVGSLNNSSLTNSFTTAGVSATATAGGLVGATNSAVTITNSHAYNTVSDANYIGGFIGVIQNPSLTFEGNTYYDNSHNGQAVGTQAINPEGITYSSNNPYAGPVATVTGTASVAAAVTAIETLVAAGATTIGLGDAKALQALSDYVAAGHNCEDLTFCLTNNIDLQGVTWTPIGTYDTNDLWNKMFLGNFNGNGYTISNLSVSGTDYVGLFGMASCSTDHKISNVALVDATVSGSGQAVGGILGGGYYAMLDNCYVTGTVSGDYAVGGLAGGGLVGIYNSHSAATVSGQSEVGGLFGAGGVEMDNSYATGHVTGETMVGGLIGCTTDQAESTISGSHAYNIVTGTGANTNIGSLIGKVNVNDTISSNTYYDNTHDPIGNMNISSFGAQAGVYSSTIPPAATGGNLGLATVTGTASVAAAVTAIENMVAAGATTIGLGDDKALQALAEYVNTGSHNCSGITFCLTDDIDLDGVTWTAIGNNNVKFEGEFYGNGHEITNLAISGTYNVGLFGIAQNARFVDVAITNAHVTGHEGVGILLGSATTNCAIENCYTTGEISGNTSAGGLIGYVISSTIDDSYSAAAVSGLGKLGGLVGILDDSSVHYSYATGNVDGTDVAAGGLFGEISTPCDISNCHAYNNVTGLDYVGGFVGNDNTDGDYTDCDNTYFDINLNACGAGNTRGITQSSTIPPSATGGLTGVATVTGTASVAAAVTEIETLVAAGATTIGLGDANAMQALSDYVADGNDCTGLTFCLTNNVDLRGVTWTPIGRSGNKFKGDFDGNGYTISNLSVSGSDYVGLFGWVDTGTISDVALVNATVSGSTHYVGGIAGLVGGTINNCYVIGDISGNNDVGAIAGWAYGTVTNCYACGEVEGNTETGGIVGTISNVLLNNNHAYNTVSGSGANIGGLVGSAANTNTYQTNTYLDNTHDSRGVGSLATNPSGVSYSTYIPDYATGGMHVATVTGTADVASAVTAIENLIAAGATTIELGDEYALQALSDYANAGNNCAGITFTLAKNMDLDGVTWHSIGTVDNMFRGNFNGNGHTISNLSLSGAGRTGFFGVVMRSTISNTAIIDATINASGVDSGILAGNLQYSAVENCYTSGSINGTDSVGGLFGYSIFSNVSNSYSTGNVSGSGDVGGLAGRIDDTTINASNSYCTVSGNSSVGGLIGAIGNHGIGTCSFNNNTYYDNSHNGIGSEATNPSGITQTSYIPTAASGGTVTATVGGTNVSEAASALRDLIASDADNIGISSAAALQALAQVVNGVGGAALDCSGKTFLLMNDIDLSGISWTAIGNDYYHGFLGNFNGNGHTISNLSASGTNCVGLFGRIGHSTISNTAIINATINASGNSAGVIAGEISESLIENCYVTGSVNGTSASGGLGGYVSDSTIDRSYFAGNVSGYQCVGGLLGIDDSNSLTHVYALGTVSGTTLVGGLIGSDDNTGKEFYDCHAYTVVNGSGTEVGSFFGNYDCENNTFTNCTYFDNTHSAAGFAYSDVSAITYLSTIPTSASQGVTLTNETTLASLGVTGDGVISINGITVGMTPGTTISAVIGKINENTASTGVTASLNGGNIVLTSSANGTVTVTDSSGNVAQVLGLTNTQGISGSYQVFVSSIDPDEAIVGNNDYNLGGTQVGTGTFSINGSVFTITASTTLNDIISSINATINFASATFDATANKFIINGTNSSNILITDGTSNFMSALGFATSVDAQGTNSANAGTVTISGWKATTSSIIQNNTTDFTQNVTQGTFKINNQTFTIGATTTLGQLMNSINNSSVGVHVDYANGKLTFSSTNNQDFTMEKGTSNFTDVFGLTHTVSATTYSRNENAFFQDVAFDMNARIAENPNLFYGSTMVTTGNFFVNGVEFNINSNTTLNSLLNAINTNTNAFAHAEVITDNNGYKKIQITSTHPTNHAVSVQAGNSNFTDVVHLTENVLQRSEIEQNQVLGSDVQHVGRATLDSVLVDNVQFKSVGTGDDAISIEAGNFVINGVNFNITNTTTLGDIINSINSSNADVTAYWNDQTGKLTITSNTEGDHLINFQDGTSNFLTVMRVTAAAAQTLGSDGHYSFYGGDTIVANTNTITSDISGIDGLTINLKDVSQSQNGRLVADKLTIESDTRSLESAVNNFVDMYNELVTELDAATGTGGILHKDVTLKSLSSQIKSALNSTVNNGGTYRLLSQLGISTAAPGAAMNANTSTLTVDNDKLHRAVSTDSSEVKKFMLGTDTEYTNGAMTRLNNLLFKTLSSTGFFTTRNNLLSNQITRYETLINTAKTRVSNYRSNLENKFSSMENLISSLKGAYSKMYSTLGISSSVL